jgi:PAS domain S-box-containing protein
MDLTISEVNLNGQRLFTGFVRDITARREAEKQTRYQATLLQNISEAVIGLDTDFVTIRSWNKAAEKIYGFAAAEVLGRSVLDVLKPDFFDVAIEEAGQTFRDTGYWTGEVVQRRKDGARLLVAASASVVKDLAGNVIGEVYVNRDVTAQKKAEAALKALEREVLEISNREQRRIGQDLHDGLGAHLTGIAMVCRTLARRAEKGKPVSQEELDNVANLVQEGIAEARRLARGLNPVKLEKEGLTSALNELAAMMQARAGVPCTFTGAAPLPELDGEITTQLYRIAQEAVHNALKHARPRAVSIRLERDGDRLVLSVQDDGIGLPAEHLTTEGMGLRVMQYRAHIIGGAFGIRSTPGGGTLITCALPYTEAALTPTS